jgi:hypothetical protein
MEAALKTPPPPYTPLSERFNFRILMFAAILLAVVGYPFYVYLDGVLSGGVRDLGNGVKLVDLKTMSSFVFDQTSGTVNDVPEKWRALDGERVALEGEMVPPSMSAKGGAGKFELVYSVAKCCFTGAPQIQHFIQCQTGDGGEVPFIGGLVRVTGTLKVDVTRDAETGEINGVYHMTVDEVRPVG